MRCICFQVFTPVLRLGIGILVLPWIASCDDAQITQSKVLADDKTLSLEESSSAPRQRALSYATDTLPCEEDFETQSIAIGELLLKSCWGEGAENEDGESIMHDYLATEFNFVPIMGDHPTIARKSYDHECTSWTGVSKGYNLVIGLRENEYAGVNKCEDTDNDDLLEPYTTYLIYDTIRSEGSGTDDHFLAHWLDEHQSLPPDVWAWSIEGIFDEETIDCTGESAARCSGTDVPGIGGYEMCYAIYHGIPDEIKEHGGGDTSCDGAITWADLIDIDEAKPSGSASKLIKFAVEDGTQTAYDWEYATDKDFLVGDEDYDGLSSFVAGGTTYTLTFASGVGLPSTILGLPISVYGDLNGTNMTVEGWRYDN